MDHHENGSRINRMALSATLHCLTGCAVGEILGLMIGTVADEMDRGGPSTGMYLRDSGPHVAAAT